MKPLTDENCWLVIRTHRPVASTDFARIATKIVCVQNFARMSTSWFHYTKAVVRGVSSKFAEGSLKLGEPEEAINLTKANEQWSKYVSGLKDLGLEVIHVPADDKFPDCVFIEDAAVVCDDIALITRPGHVSRQGETAAVRNSLEKLGMLCKYRANMLVNILGLFCSIVALHESDEN